MKPMKYNKNDYPEEEINPLMMVIKLQLLIGIFLKLLSFITCYKNKKGANHQNHPSIPYSY